VSIWLAACAGHAERTLQARNALDAGHPAEALALLNEELGVDGADQVPNKTGAEVPLLLLDRAMVLQQLDRYQLASRDLQVADKNIEILDFSRNAADDLGRYLFSDDTGPYRAPPYEKLMINTMNLVNYLVQADLNGARIEAKRLSVMQRYLEEHEDRGVSLTGLGGYLAGFALEKSGRPQEALRYYDEALQYGEYRSLVGPISRLARQATYRTPRIRALLAETAPTQPPRGQPDAQRPSSDAEPFPLPNAATKPPAEAQPPPAASDGEILAVVSYGRVPAKHAERVPIGLALTWAASHMNPAQASQANRLAAQGLVTWVNYPELGRPRGRFAVPRVAVDGEWQSMEGVLAVDLETHRAWEQAKGAVIASAVTRMITRVVAGEAARQAAKDNALGLLLSLGTQAVMTAADTPDTRSWATLPARIAVARVRVRPGVHWVVLEARGISKRQQVQVPPRGWAVANLTVLH
jgi:hypothetical protein